MGAKPKRPATAQCKLNPAFLFAFWLVDPRVGGVSDDAMACPACGGAGGGPFGRPGSAWDVETYECPRCHGLGSIGWGDRAAARPLAKSAGRPPNRAEETPGVVNTRPSPKRAKAGTGRQDK
jgi:hypothetical protein